MNKPQTDAKMAEIKENAYRSVKTILKLIECGKHPSLKSIYNEVSATFDVPVRMLESRMKKFREGGWEALNPSHGGKSPGDDSLLTEENEKLIQSIILDRTPDQLKMPFALWTRSAVQELIERELGIHLSITCVGNYLRRWGFTCQRPKLTATEQNRKGSTVA
ncbi:MAG: winged helix-turn-helix domain-containing protein [Fibrobacteres bacterium]|nr:winged helix-turn-helix domain-containing protein [Fibrobacterota bacterium]